MDKFIEIKKHFPIIIVGICIFFGLIITVETKLNVNFFAVPSYVILIFSLGLSLILSTISSFVFLFGRFNNYWETDYPIALMLLIGSYGLLKTSSEWHGLSTYAMGLLVGVFAGVFVLKNRQHGFCGRVIPAASLAIVLSCSEFGNIFIDAHFFFQVIMPGIVAFLVGILFAGVYRWHGQS